MVVQDRGFLSTIAYQGYGRELNLSVIQWLNELTTGHLYPDLVLFLDVKPGEARKRGSMQDRIEQSGDDFHDQVWRGFATEITRSRNYVKSVRIDGTQPPDRVFEDVVRVLAEKILN